MIPLGCVFPRTRKMSTARFPTARCPRMNPGQPIVFHFSSSGWTRVVLHKQRLAVFAVEEIAHYLAAGFVRFLCGLAFFCGHAALGYGVGCFGIFAALGATVGEAGYV